MNNEEILVKASEIMKLKGFSPKTVKAYLYNTSKFMKYFDKSIDAAQKNDVVSYVMSLVYRNLEENTIRQIVASLDFVFREVLGKNIVSKQNVPRTKRKKQLPRVLAKKEIDELLNNIKNEKHKLMISFLYSSGLRVSELVNLKRKDLNFERGVVHVKSGKGKKDRITILSEFLKKTLMNYICQNSFHTQYLFETQRLGKYNVRTVEEIVKKASKNMRFHTSPHMLRHSFATYLLEEGVDIRHIQKLPGYSKLETTSIYTHVAKSDIENIRSPIDSFHSNF